MDHSVMLSGVGSSAGRSYAVEASLSAVTDSCPNRSPQQKARLDQLAVKREAHYYFFLPVTFAPMRNSFLTVPVGSLFISSCNSVTASKNPAIAAIRSRVNSAPASPAPPPASDRSPAASSAQPPAGTSPTRLSSTHNVPAGRPAHVPPARSPTPPAPGSTCSHSTAPRSASAQFPPPAAPAATNTAAHESAPPSG